MTNDLDAKYASLISELENRLGVLNSFINGGPDDTVVTNGRTLLTLAGIQKKLLEVRYSQRIKDHKLLSQAQADDTLEEGMLVRVWGDTTMIIGLYKVDHDLNLNKISYVDLYDLGQ